MNATEDLLIAYEALKRVLATADEGALEELTSVFHNLETVMTDHFDVVV